MRRPLTRISPSGRRSGLTLLEVILGLAVMAFVLGVATLYLHRQASTMSSSTRDSGMMHRAEIMLDEIADDLRFAKGDVPTAWLTEDLNAGASAFLELDTTLPFPDSGTLLLQPGSPQVERIDYAAIDPGSGRLLMLGRGSACTTEGDHPAGTAVLWAPAATAIDDQDAPDAAFFDGASQELLGDVFFRGDGSGFAFRVPVDPAGGQDYFDASGEIQWGAVVDGAGTPDGRACFRFTPVAKIEESARGADLNGDGDEDDTFDLGQISKRVWDSNAGGASGFEVALCPPMVLQEVCRWGADLDADGLDDPIFLWEPASSRLRIRLFLLDAGRDGAPVVRTSEVSYFLRNGVDQ